MSKQSALIFSFTFSDAWYPAVFLWGHLSVVVWRPNGARTVCAL